MSPTRQTIWLTGLALALFLGLRRLPDTHCALLHADHQPVVVDGLEFCGVNDEANFYRPRDLKFPYALKIDLLGVGSARMGRLVLADEDGRPLRDHQLALTHTRKLHLHLRSLAQPGYAHLHPVAREDGGWTFELPVGFDFSAGVHAYVDFAPVRNGRVVLAEAILPPQLGSPPLPEPVGGPLMVANFTQSEQHPAQSALLRLRLRRADGAPVKLRPLMGTLGHAVLVSADTAESAMGYAHLHPSLEGGEYDLEPTLSFRLRLPKVGAYDLWLHVDDGVDRYLRVPVVVTP